MVALWFAVIYGGADWITAQRTVNLEFPSVAVPLDRCIPFWPYAAWIYMSITPLLLLPLLVFQSRSHITSLAGVLCAEIAVAGMIYLIFPVAQTRTPDLPLPDIMRLADQINLTYNSLPSLHVALSVTSACAMLQRGRSIRNLGMAIWGVAVIASTLVTHQHFIADVVAGIVLAGAGLLAFWRLTALREAAW